MASATCSGRLRVASRMPWLSRGVRPRGGVGGGGHCSKCRPDAVGLGLGQQPLVLGVVDRLGLVDEHDGDPVPDRVAALGAGVVERVLVGEVEERAPVGGAGQDLQQAGVERHGRPQPFPAMRSRTSATWAWHDSGSAASRLSRRTGSVLEARRLNHQSPKSTVRPSTRSWSAPDGVGVGHPLDDRLGVVDGDVDLARGGVALERLAQLGQRLVGLGQQLEHDQGGDDAGVGPEVVGEVVVAAVLAAEDGARLGHHRLDERVADPGAHRACRPAR